MRYQKKSGSKKKRAKAKKPTPGEMQASIIRRAIKRAGMLSGKRDTENACRRGQLVAVRHGNMVELSDLDMGVSTGISSRSAGAAKAVLEALRLELHKGFDGDIADLARSVANDIAAANGETVQDSTGGKSAGMLAAALDSAEDSKLERTPDGALVDERGNVAELPSPWPQDGAS